MPLQEGQPRPLTEPERHKQGIDVLVNGIADLTGLERATPLAGLGGIVGGVGPGDLAGDLRSAQQRSIDRQREAATAALPPVPQLPMHTADP